mmetsp:Transcript_74256/g.194737  ORF Transcript_74256/g.194737 Transcript_74256/m.194737 type:complete len:298 (-) Transcript_74256:128-1021(-)
MALSRKLAALLALSSAPALASADIAKDAPSLRGTPTPQASNFTAAAMSNVAADNTTAAATSDVAAATARVATAATAGDATAAAEMFNVSGGLAAGIAGETLNAVAEATWSYPGYSAHPGYYGYPGHYPPDLLRRICHGSSGYCNLAGHMIVPRERCDSMERINGGNAQHYDQFMNAAYRYCSSPGCVLVTNPVGHRTQNQLHIHYWQMNGHGHALKRRLEDQLCLSDGGWQSFSECGTGKAKLFPSMPGAFSAAAEAFGNGPMTHIGLTVWPGACGGRRVIVLATTDCSIEHDISPR